MSRQTITEEIAAPVLAVFAVLSNAEQFAAARPHVVRTEFVSEQRTGIGTVFHETPKLRGTR